MYKLFMDIITHPAFSLATGGTGILAGYYLSRTKDIENIKMVEFNKAAAAFHAAFLDDIIFTEDTAPAEIYTRLLEMILTKGIEQKLITTVQRKEMLKFRQYIPEADHPAFDAAWEAYYCLNKNEDDSTDEGKKFVLHLHNILQFAKLKI